MLSASNILMASASVEVLATISIQDQSVDLSDAPFSDRCMKSIQNIRIIVDHVRVDVKAELTKAEMMTSLKRRERIRIASQRDMEIRNLKRSIPDLEVAIKSTKRIKIKRKKDLALNPPRTLINPGKKDQKREEQTLPNGLKKKRKKSIILKQIQLISKTVVTQIIRNLLTIHLLIKMITNKTENDCQSIQQIIYTIASNCILSLYPIPKKT
jgi:hypothetical protein